MNLRDEPATKLSSNYVNTLCSNNNWYSKLISITLSILNGFSKFFHWHTLRKICDKLLLTIPPHPTRVDTLPCEYTFSKIAPIKAQQRQTKHTWTKENVLNDAHGRRAGTKPVKPATDSSFSSTSWCCEIFFSRPYWVVRSRLWYDVLSLCRLSVCL